MQTRSHDNNSFTIYSKDLLDIKTKDRWYVTNNEDIKGK